jgi:predicted transcriptional regulator of viral defense system
MDISSTRFSTTSNEELDRGHSQELQSVLFEEGDLYRLKKGIYTTNQTFEP